MSLISWVSCLKVCRTFICRKHENKTLNNNSAFTAEDKRKHNCTFNILETLVNKLKRKEGRKCFVHDTLNKFYIWGGGGGNDRGGYALVWVKDHSEKGETCCRLMGYSFQLAARFFLYASSHRQDITYHSLCYTSHRALAGMRNSRLLEHNNTLLLNMVLSEVMSNIKYYQIAQWVHHEGSMQRPITP